MLSEIAYSARTGRKITMIYMTDAQSVSQRTVQIIACHKKVVKAFCYTKRAFRTFKIANILAVQFIDEQIGEDVS